MPFESVIQPITGDFKILVQDPNGVDPDTTILRATDAWQVVANWSISGAAAAAIDASKTWHLSIRLESMGGGFEGPVAHVRVPAVGGAVQNYTEPITIAANRALAKDVDSQLYKLVAVLTLTQGVTEPLPIAAYQEGPMLQFYLPG